MEKDLKFKISIFIIFNLIIFIAIIRLLLYELTNELKINGIAMAIVTILLSTIWLLSELNKVSQNSQTFNILLQSYNKNTGDYQIDKQEIIETDWNEFFNYLRNLPPISFNQPISAKIISDDFIISRDSSDNFLVNWNYESKFYFTIPKFLRNGIKIDF